MHITWMNMDEHLCTISARITFALCITGIPDSVVYFTGLILWRGSLNHRTKSWKETCFSPRVPVLQRRHLSALFEDPARRFLYLFQLSGQMRPLLGQDGQRVDHGFNFPADPRFSFLEAPVAGVPSFVGAALEALVEAQTFLLPRQLCNSLEERHRRPDGKRMRDR